MTLVSKEALVCREIEIAKRSPVTPGSREVAGYRFTMPENVQGWRILEVGSGISTLVAELNRNGANAVGLDYRYGDFKQLKRDAEKLFNSSYYQQQRDPAVRRALKDMRKTKDRFFDLGQKGIRPYVAGLAGHLPFASNSFDLVLDAALHTTVFIKDVDVFMATLFEEVRVVKPGKQVQCSPWRPPEWSLEDRLRAMAILVRLERCHDISVEVKLAPVLNQEHLVVTKKFGDS